MAFGRLEDKIKGGSPRTISPTNHLCEPAGTISVSTITLAWGVFRELKIQTVICIEAMWSAEVDIRKDTDSRSPMTFSKLNLKLSKLSLSRTNKRESFKYKRLPKDSIRLLTVLLRDDASPEIQLETYSRDRAPDFDALSYTWGEDTSTSVILCNKLQLTIRTNLFEAIPLISSSRPPPHTAIVD